MPTLHPGSKLGPYEIVSLLGQGGMGEVYRARDERLGRGVAIKVLPPAFASDPERIARFQREARTLATLNHAGIAGIHGVEEWKGTAAIVMELVEGDDLANRLARGPLPLDDALAVARQIAEALEAAHLHGVVHRDLKPANVMIRADGTVKLLDFGLAKVLEPAALSSGIAQDPTITSAELTHAGLVLGTAAYMSPEQARGKLVDRRADVWAFGCVLYEMLTGRRAFAGDNHSDVVAAILTSAPDFSLLPAHAPLSIRRLLRRCLQKDTPDRLRDMGDAVLELRDARSSAEDVATVVADGPSAVGWRRERLAWIAGVLMLLAMIAALRLQPAERPTELRVEISTPPTPSPVSVAISPDGTAVVFVATSGGESRLWLRSLRSEVARQLDGTEGAESPFWSPDSRSVGFFAGGRLKRVDVESGSVQTLANAATGTHGTWGRQNIIIFASRGNPISRVSAEDPGDPVAVEGLVPGGNFSPTFLPDGDHFLYYHRGSPEVRGIYVGGLTGASSRRRVLESDTGAVYAASGHLLFIFRDALLAQAFDVERLTVSGDPFTVANAVPGRSVFFGLAASVSDTGSIAYRVQSAGARRQFMFFDRSGKTIGDLGGPGQTFSSPSLSGDGTRVAFYRALEGNVDIWTMDTARGASVRLTSDTADDVSPVWSPDSRRIAFSSNRTGTLQIYVRPGSGEGQEDLLLSTPAFKIPTDWSADDQYLLFTAEGTKRSLDIWALPLHGERKPFAVVQSANFTEQGAQFSPDSRWIAYQSNESGRDEIYIRGFPDGGEKLLVSTAGGAQARWNRNGQELFYVARNGDLMAVSLHFPSGGAAPSIGTPNRLFELPIGSAIHLGDARHQYMISPDGQRVLVATSTPPPTAPISLILNWNARP